MCAVSMIVGHYQEWYPNPLSMPSYDYPHYAELVRKAKLYDELMKQPDCPSPEKDEWHRKLEKFMRDKYGLEPHP